jgi:hypothetical protein
VDLQPNEEYPLELDEDQDTVTVAEPSTADPQLDHQLDHQLDQQFRQSLYKSIEHDLMLSASGVFDYNLKNTRYFDNHQGINHGGDEMSGEPEICAEKIMTADHFRSNRLVSQGMRGWLEYVVERRKAEILRTLAAEHLLLLKRRLAIKAWRENVVRFRRGDYHSQDSGAESESEYTGEYQEEEYGVEEYISDAELSSGQEEYNFNQDLDDRKVKLSRGRRSEKSMDRRKSERSASRRRSSSRRRSASRTRHRSNENAWDNDSESRKAKSLRKKLRRKREEKRRVLNEKRRVEKRQEREMDEIADEFYYTEIFARIAARIVETWR